MGFGEVVEAVGKAVDAVGVAVIVLGVGWALIRYALAFNGGDAYTAARRSIGRAVLLGLEVLVAGDIIRTVAVSPTFTSVGVLAGIVAIRTFLSFTLEMEISSRWPWQREEPTFSPGPDQLTATHQSGDGPPSQKRTRRSSLTAPASWVVLAMPVPA